MRRRHSSPHTASKYGPGRLTAHALSSHLAVSGSPAGLDGHRDGPPGQMALQEEGVRARPASPSTSTTPARARAGSPASSKTREEEPKKSPSRAEQSDSKAPAASSTWKEVLFTVGGGRSARRDSSASVSGHMKESKGWISWHHNLFHSHSHSHSHSHGSGGGAGEGSVLAATMSVGHHHHDHHDHYHDHRHDHRHDHHDDHYGKAGSTSEPGTLLKKYGVYERTTIGKGSTAIVRLAHKRHRQAEGASSSRGGEWYAVKEFRKRRRNEHEKEYVKKLTSEFCISSSLHHANVVETVDLVQDEKGHWCQVMEFCPGGDLYSAIQRSALSQAEWECYFKQLMLGIVYLHSMGVAHRDIKPENLLLDQQGTLKITDFGSAGVFRMCWEEHVHYQRGLCGSEPYIAPEQFEQGEYDARLVDVWSAGIVLYCLQLGELPWRVAKMSDPTFNSFVHTYYADAEVREAPLALLSPPECRSCAKQMLCPDPMQRMSTEQVVAQPWFQAIKMLPRASQDKM